MDNNSNVSVLIVLVVFFVFSFIYSFQSLVGNNINYLYLSLAFVGFILSIIVGLIFGLSTYHDGARLSLWFFIYTGAVAVTLVWYLTRVGRVFGIL